MTIWNSCSWVCQETTERWNLESFLQLRSSAHAWSCVSGQMGLQLQTKRTTDAEDWLGLIAFVDGHTHNLGFWTRLTDNRDLKRVPLQLLRDFAQNHQNTLYTQWAMHQLKFLPESYYALKSDQ
jgi:hypothetical protein